MTLGLRKRVGRGGTGTAVAAATRFCATEDVILPALAVSMQLKPPLTLPSPARGEGILHRKPHQLRSLTFLYPRNVYK